jgi:PTS system N-acetylglucosamine-specific IIC component
LIIPIGLVFAAVYYVLFRFAITKFNLPTPGREPEEEVEDLTKA